MQLKRLDSTSRPQTPVVAPAKSAAAPQVQPVTAAEAVDNERRRSLLQEMAEVDTRSLGPFAGGEQVKAEAHKLAEHLVVLGNHGEALLKLRALSQFCRHVDDQA